MNIPKHLTFKANVRDAESSFHKQNRLKIRRDKRIKCVFSNMSEARLIEWVKYNETNNTAFWHKYGYIAQSFLPEDADTFDF